MVGPAGGGAAASGSSCLSVFGLAYDATEREVHVLFSGCPGYSRCIVVPGKGSQRPYAFVQFVGQQDAIVAMESRQGTTWEDGGQAVSIEMARRDIPEKFGPRQPRGSTPAAPQMDFPVTMPAAKRLRQEPAGMYTGPPAAQLDQDTAGPRTLHVGGLPPGLTQADLDSFLSANFGDSCLGGNLDTGGGKGGSNTSPRAFVGFTAHEVAAEAQAMLEGFNWDGAQLRAEWARSEYRPQGAVGRGAGAGASLPAPALGPSAPAARGPSPGLRSSVATPYWEAAPQTQVASRHDQSGGAKRTLHFTNLPFLTEADFSSFLAATFPDQIVCAHFKDARDGRPPIAWVLFADDDTAAGAASSHQSFELQGSKVLVQYARTELDPAKFRW